MTTLMLACSERARTERSRRRTGNAEVGLAVEMRSAVELVMRRKPRMKASRQLTQGAPSRIGCYSSCRLFSMQHTEALQHHLKSKDIGIQRRDKDGSKSSQESSVW